MSTFITGTAPREQPFKCQICHSRFTRAENLKRHSSLHTRSKDDNSFTCHLCSTTFSRRDLRERHFKRKHQDQQEKDGHIKSRRRDTVTSIGASGTGGSTRSRGTKRSSKSPSAEQPDPLPGWDHGGLHEMDNVFWSLDAPLELPNADRQHMANSAPASYSMTHTQYPYTMSGQQSASTQHPGMHSIEQGPAEQELDLMLQHPIVNGNHRTMGSGVDMSPTPSSLGSSPESNMRQHEGMEVNNSQYYRDGWSPSPSQIDRGLELFFSDVSHFVPFLHQATFEPSSAAPYLVLSILSLAYQHGEDPDLYDQAGSGEQLAKNCFHRGRAMCAVEEEAEDDSTHNLTLVQSLLLLEIYAMMHMCGKTSKQGMRLHVRLVSIARSAGFMQITPPSAAKTRDLESMWRESIKAESLKRTILAAHQVDALWYQFLSVPRSMSHLEIRHELPSPEDCWMAASAAKWAHQRLGVSPGTLPVQYPDAVRRFLSRSAEVDSIPPFDPYGAINIAQFLLSSAREVSGWSTMTGQISLERFEPLRASLVALASSLCPQGETAVPSHAATRAATWEMAMIEFFIWSPSHTSGIVESSLDGMLRRSTHLAHSSELNFKEDVVAAVQPHLDWFLKYLDTTLEVKGEAPWVVLYAYRAFLLTWQLLKEGVPGAMVAVCVQDGDVRGALDWATEVFSRRTQSRLSKVIVECLTILSQ